ncbi:hypothetical protein PQX77_021773 [Marasmius sp. AFHP31]|nr:hypothetical protein PQX77_021773 [Marasmius sp. AFHP31]
MERPLPNRLFTEDDKERPDVPEEWTARTIASLFAKTEDDEEWENASEIPATIRATFTQSQRLAEAQYTKEPIKTKEDLVPVQYHDYLSVFDKKTAE